MARRITSNFQVHPLCTFDDLPTKVREDFDYVPADERQSDRFVQYRGSWYDTGDVERITVEPNHQAFGFNVPKGDPLAQWDGIWSESHWSGVVFRYLRGDLRDTYAPDDYGYVQIGRVFSE